MASADDQSDTIGIADLILHIDAKLRIALFRQKIIGQNGKTGRNRIVDIDRRDHGPGPAARIRGRTGPFEIIAVIDSYQQLVRQRAGVELETHVHVAGEALGMRPCLVRITVDNTPGLRSEEHTSELQSLMRRSYADFCLKNK